jgi:hypothetical protein
MRRREGPSIATCRYQAFQPEMGTAVNITRMPPRWKLSYQITARIRELAPTADEFKLDGLEFDAVYRRRLDAMGIDKVLRLIAEAVPEGRAVLLCYEDVWQPRDMEGEACHRRTLATWLTDQIGEEVPELSPRSQARRSVMAVAAPTPEAEPSARRRDSVEGKVSVEALVLHRDDTGYRRWMAQHPDGRVLNRQAGGGARLHRPNCGHFWTDPTRFEPTLRLKVCVSDNATAQMLATALQWQPLARCQTCRP